MDRESVFVDTWGWMALGHRREPRHVEVKRIYQELRSNGIPICTSDYVLCESDFRTSQQSRVVVKF